MSKRETYQAKATACLKEAEHLHDEQERAKMLAVAQAYMKLAEHVHENDYETDHQSEGDHDSMEKDS
jgi:hypothetical protein